MFDRDQWAEVASALMANKLRTLLTAFGVAWGMFMLLVLIGSGRGLENGVRRQFNGVAQNSFYVWTQRTTLPHRGMPVGRSFNLTNEDVGAIRESVPEVGVLASRLQLGGYGNGAQVTRGVKTGSFNVMADEPEILHVMPRKLTRGRFLNRLDLSERRKVCVIGERAVQTLFEPREEVLGEVVTINGVGFKVIGVFTSLRDGRGSDRDAQMIHIPMSTFQKAWNYGNIVGWFAMTSASSVPADVAEKRVLQVLGRRHSIHPNDFRAFGSSNTAEEFQRVQGLFTGIAWLVWVVGLGTLSAGAIGVSNIMLVIVRERTHEIGIRRALGATPLSIMRQVVLEALVLTAVAGYCGLFFGIAVLELFSLATTGMDTGVFVAPGVDLGTALKALAILIVTGILAGVVPAQRAVALSPVCALRGES